MLSNALHHHLKEFNYGKVSWNYYVLIREGQEWPNTNKSSIATYRNGNPKAIVASSVDNKTNLIFNSTGEAARHFGWKPPTLAMHIFRNGTKPYRNWIFRFIDDTSLLRDRTLVDVEKQSPTCQ